MQGGAGGIAEARICLFLPVAAGRVSRLQEKWLLWAGGFCMNQVYLDVHVKFSRDRKGWIARDERGTVVFYTQRARKRGQSNKSSFRL